MEPVEQGDDLDVAVGIVGADDLGVELEVLAVRSGLRRLVPERRAGRPRLPRHGRAVLDEGPHDARGELRTATRRPPLSSKSYISLRTMSVESPTRRKTSRCSISGVMTSPNPARSACVANVAIKLAQRCDCGARTSAMPRGAWNSGTRGQARSSSRSNHWAIRQDLVGRGSPSEAPLPVGCSWLPDAPPQCVRRPQADLRDRPEPVAFADFFALLGAAGTRAPAPPAGPPGRAPAALGGLDAGGERLHEVDHLRRGLLLGRHGQLLAGLLVGDPLAQLLRVGVVVQARVPLASQGIHELRGHA